MAVPRAVPSLFESSIKVILGSCLTNSACAVLPVRLLHYLLYQAVSHKNLPWIQDLVRYWPGEKLSFEFDQYVDDTDDHGEELHLRRHYSWYHTAYIPLLRFPRCVFDAIATGLYMRVYHCQSECARMLEPKHFIVDLSMLGKEYNEQDNLVLKSFVNLCHGSEQLARSSRHGSANPTVFYEKVSIHVSLYSDEMLTCTDTSPCALVPTHVNFLLGDSRKEFRLLKSLKNITSVHYGIRDRRSAAAFVELVTVLQKQCSLNEVAIRYCNDEELCFFDMPSIACRRIYLGISPHCFPNMLQCAYHPNKKLQSLHVDATALDFDEVTFNSDISEIIDHNCESLLDLSLSDVIITRNDTLLQGTLQKCHSLVVLSLHTNTGLMKAARLYEIFNIIKCLLSLEYLNISFETNVFAVDLCCLHKLLQQDMPKLKQLYLSFHLLVVYFASLEDPSCEPIKDLLNTLLAHKQPSRDSQTLVFSWKKNQLLHTWLTSLRSDVNFKLL